MFILSVRSHFDSAHRLDGYEGKCAYVHGHRWEAEIEVAVMELDPVGMGIDLVVLKKLLNSVTEQLDHSFLNELPSFKEKNPTAENIAYFIYQQMKNLLPESADLKGVRIFESPDSSVYYTEGVYGVKN